MRSSSVTEQLGPLSPGAVSLRACTHIYGAPRQASYTHTHLHLACKVAATPQALIRRGGAPQTCCMFACRRPASRHHPRRHDYCTAGAAGLCRHLWLSSCSSSPSAFSLRRWVPLLTGRSSSSSSLAPIISPCVIHTPGCMISSSSLYTCRHLMGSSPSSSGPEAEAGAGGGGGPSAGSAVAAEAGGGRSCPTCWGARGNVQLNAVSQHAAGPS